MPFTLLGPPNTRFHTPEALEKGIRAFFGSELPIWDDGILEKIFNVTTSSKMTESTVVEADLGQAVVKAEGGPPASDALQEVYKQQTTHVTYALMVEFTEEAIEDNLYEQIVPRAGRALARSMGYTRQVQAFSFFNDLTETIYTYNGTGYQLLEYQGHPLLVGGTWSNRPENAATLSQASLEERLTAWATGMLDHRGFKVRSTPKFLMVGPSNWLLAHRLLKSVHRPQSADNDVNPVKDLYDLEPLLNPHMTDDGRWFLIGDKRSTNLRFYDRVKAGTDRFTDGPTGNIRIRARMRFSKEVPAAYGIMGSPGT